MHCIITCLNAITKSTLAVGVCNHRRGRGIGDEIDILLFVIRLEDLPVIN